MQDNWDYTARPTCYGYKHELKEHDNPDFDEAEIEVNLEGTGWDNQTTGGIEIGIWHYEKDKPEKYLDSELTWVTLPREEVIRLHKILGNMIEYTEQS